MTNINKTLIGGFLLTSLFSGCATKSNKTLACFKNSSSCIAQEMKVEKKCVTCIATI